MSANSTSTPPISGNTQYNDNNLFDAYSKLCPPDGITPSNYDLGHIEAYQLQRTLTSSSQAHLNIKDKHILDLACGNGYYSHKHLSWGAASVTALDISLEMIERGRKHAEAQGIPTTRLKFLLGDAMNPDLTIEGSPFDMVTASWLLNYAPDKSVMTRIWTFIGRNLKPGGTFVGLTIPPIITSQPYEHDLLSHLYGPKGAWGRRGNAGEVLETLPKGIGFKVRTDLWCEGIEGVASFENYHLRLDIFEGACQDSGLFEGLEWREFVIPQSAKVGKPVGVWNDLVALPNCRVCVARRKQ